MSLVQKPTERHSLEDEAQQAIEEEALATAEAVRAKRRTELLFAKLASETKVPAPVDACRLTRGEYARREKVSEATVSRWLAEGLPAIPVGTTVRIDPVAADEWRRARGRKATTSKPRTSEADHVDVDANLASVGLRVVGGRR